MSQGLVFDLKVSCADQRLAQRFDEHVIELVAIHELYIRVLTIRRIV